MPGKSKKGGGLTSSPIYKKQAYGTAKSPFMMKGWSPFMQKTHPQHPVTPPTKEESKKSKGTLSGGWGSDFFEGVKTGWRNIKAATQKIKNR